MTFFHDAGVEEVATHTEQIFFGVTKTHYEEVGKPKRWGRRLTDSGIYALLSITAKVALDFGFLALIFVREQEPDKK